MASLWELAIKFRLGKLWLNEPFLTFVDNSVLQNNFQILQITPSHIAQMTELPFHHKDPFDRLLIAQAIAENMVMVSQDVTLVHYPVQIFW